MGFSVGSTKSLATSADRTETDIADGTRILVASIAITRLLEILRCISTIDFVQSIFNTLPSFSIPGCWVIFSCKPKFCYVQGGCGPASRPIGLVGRLASRALKNFLSALLHREIQLFWAL